MPDKPSCFSMSVLINREALQAAKTDAQAMPPMHSNPKTIFRLLKIPCSDSIVFFLFFDFV